MIPTRRFLAVAAAGCLALTLAACGGGGSGASAPGTAAGAGRAPVSGGHGRLLTLAEPQTLDPAALGNAYAAHAAIGNALYGTLMVDDPATGGVKYSMAESFETTDGGSTFTLKLRPGLVFSDGSPLDATAVKVNWDRVKDPANGSPSQYEASLAASTEVVDPATLKVTMSTPIPSYAQSVLSTPMNWIASPAALQAGRQAFDLNPIGAGPFTLKSWVRQGDLDLVRNPRYFDAPKPYLDSLTLRAAVDANQRLTTMVSGGADVAVESNWVNLAKAAESKLPTTATSLSGGLYLALNSRRAPFDDVRARQAVSAALDLDALDLAVFSGKGDRADTLFSTTSPFHTDTPLHRTDKVRAQQLFDELAAAGKPVSFTFTSFPSSENRATAEAVQAQLSAFKNVTVQVKVVDLSQAAALRQTHDFDVILSSAAFGDPEPRLWTVFTSTSAQNLSAVADPELDAALQTGRTATTTADRMAAYQKVQDRLLALTPVIFLDRIALGVVASRDVGGVTQYGIGSLLPADLWIKE
jgi:peptide/nickel transport system substrate-binding protein